MTFLHFISYLIITFILLIVIKAFWKQIAVVALALYMLGQILIISFVSAILWAIFITHSAAGWGWTFLYFILVITGGLIVYAMIVGEIFTMVGDAIISFFKRVK